MKTTYKIKTNCNVVHIRGGWVTEKVTEPTKVEVLQEKVAEVLTSNVEDIIANRQFLITITILLTMLVGWLLYTYLAS